MEIFLQSNGLICGSANLLGLDGEKIIWIGGHEDPMEFIGLMNDIEKGLVENVPTNLKYKFFYQEGDLKLPITREDFLKVPEPLRELAELSI